MGRVDRFIVPGTVVAAMLAMFFVTNTWIRRPVDILQWKVTMGPLNISRPRHIYGLRFTPRNSLSGHALKSLVPLTGNCPPRHNPCVDVTIVNRSLTYLHRAKAFRLPDGSYRLPYAFPQADDYVLFVEMQPRDGPYQAYREIVNLSHCRARNCPAGRAILRGQEAVRSQYVDGLTVVLGAPVGAVDSGQPARATLIYLRGGRTALGVPPPNSMDGDAVAVSMDTYHFVRLRVDRARSGKGIVTYTGEFDAPSIYRLWAPVPASHLRAQASFVIDVNPAPTPTPAGQ